MGFESAGLAGLKLFGNGADGVDGRVAVFARLDIDSPFVGHPVVVTDRDRQCGGDAEFTGSEQFRGITFNILNIESVGGLVAVVERYLVGVVDLDVDGGDVVGNQDRRLDDDVINRRAAVVEFQFEIEGRNIAGDDLDTLGLRGVFRVVGGNLGVAGRQPVQRVVAIGVGGGRFVADTDRDLREVLGILEDHLALEGALRILSAGLFSGTTRRDQERTQGNQSNG